MPTSGSTNWTMNRDAVIELALRRVTAFGKGETPGAQDVTDAAVALNAIVKEEQAHGMPLWKISTFSFTPTASTASYAVYVSGTVNRYPPLKLLEAWYRNTSSSVDTPIRLITRSEYNMLSNKSTTGYPSQLYYNPPGHQGQTSNEPRGTIYLWNVPNTTFVASNDIYCTGVFPFEDFDAATDSPDFPSYFNNALSWILASQLAFEYGVPPSRIAQINLMAKESRERALQSMPEEGSMFIQPAPRFG